MSETRLRPVRIRPEYLLLAGSLLVALALVEVILRLHYSLTYSGTLEDLSSQIPPSGTEVELGDMLAISVHPRMVYQLKPHLDVRYKGVEVVTNALGFREATLPQPKGPETIRIVGIGDSVMFGQGVEESQRYMDVLERRLGETFQEASWETVTLAISGYNLMTEIGVLEEYGLRYEPDLVIYGYVGNDLCLPNFVSLRQSVWSFDSFIAYYWRRSGVEETLHARQKVALESGGVNPQEVLRIDRDLFAERYCSAGNFPPEYRHLVGLESFTQALQDFAKIGREHDIPTIFMSYGGPAKAGEFVLPEGIHFIDLRRLYGRYLGRHGYATLGESDLVLSEADKHPSAKAHRIIGTALAERLANRGLIEDILARRGRTNG